MIVKGGAAGAPACAACKFQRRRCTPACPLAPYFPANNPKMFQNVHRLFGVSNVTKTLARLKNKDDRDDAMKSIIYEAEMRDKFPASGCGKVIAVLQLQIKRTVEELHHVCALISAYRQMLNLDPSSTQDFMNENTAESNYIMNTPLLKLESQMESFEITQEMNRLSYQHFENESIHEEQIREWGQGPFAKPKSDLFRPIDR